MARAVNILGTEFSIRLQMLQKLQCFTTYVEIVASARSPDMVLVTWPSFTFDNRFSFIGSWNEDAMGDVPLSDTNCQDRASLLCFS